MATGRLGVLLRRSDQARSTFPELFFDLVFVLALFQLSHALLKDLSWHGAFQTLVLLLAFFQVWTYATMLTNRFDPQHPLIQLLVLTAMFGTLVMAAAVSKAFGGRGLVFAGVYVTVTVGAAAVAMVLLRGHQAHRHAVRILFWLCISAVPWIAGGLLTGWGREALWITAAAVDYAGIALGFPTPRLGRSGWLRSEVVITEEHAAERYQLFFIVALGEPILVSGLTFANAGFDAKRGAATLLAFTITVLLARIYIVPAGELLADAVAAARNPRRVAVLTIYAHLTMIAGVIAIAVGNELAITDPLGHTDPAWVAVILGGPALFLAGRATFQYAVFDRVSTACVIGALAFVALIPAIRSAPPLALATSATLLLAGVALADTVHTRRFPSKPPPPN